MEVFAQVFGGFDGMGDVGVFVIEEREKAGLKGFETLHFDGIQEALGGGKNDGDLFPEQVWR